MAAKSEITYLLKLDTTGVVQEVNKVTKSFSELDKEQQKFAKNATKVSASGLQKYIDDLKQLREQLKTIPKSFVTGQLAAKLTGQINTAEQLLALNPQTIKLREKQEKELTRQAQVESQKRIAIAQEESLQLRKIAQARAENNQKFMFGITPSTGLKAADMIGLANLAKQEEEALKRTQQRQQTYLQESKAIADTKTNYFKQKLAEEEQAAKAVIAREVQARQAAADKIATNAAKIQSDIAKSVGIGQKVSDKDVEKILEKFASSKFKPYTADLDAIIAKQNILAQQSEQQAARVDAQNKKLGDEVTLRQQIIAKQKEQWDTQAKLNIAAKQAATMAQFAPKSGVIGTATASTLATGAVPFTSKAAQQQSSALNAVTQALNAATQATQAFNLASNFLIPPINNLYTNFLKFVDALRQHRQGISDSQKATLDMANAIKQEIANRDALRKAYSNLHPELKKAAVARQEEIRLQAEITKLHKTFEADLAKATTAQDIQRITNSFRTMFATLEAGYKKAVADGQAAEKNFIAQAKALEKLQQKAASWGQGKQVGWVRTGQLNQLQASGATPSEIEAQKIKFRLEDIDKQYEKLLNKFNSKILNPKLDQAALSKIKQNFLTEEASLQKQRAAQQQLLADIERTNNKLQEQVHHHDSLIVRAVKLVSIYTVLNSLRMRAVQGLQSIPATGIELESTEAIFKAIFVTQKDIEKQMSFLDNLADRTGARLLTLQESFRDFAASAKFSGESIGNIQQIFNDLTEAGTVLHLPADKMKSALIAVNQMYAKGQVMMEELKRQLGNQLPAAVAVFARSMNLTTAQLMDKMKRGLIKPEDSVAGFAALYKQIFATRDAFEIASQGINANIGRLDTEWTRLAQSIYKSTSSLMIGALKGLTNTLKYTRENIGLIGTIAGVAAVAVGVHLVEAFVAYSVAASKATYDTLRLSAAWTTMTASARAAALASTGTLASVGTQLATLGGTMLRWSGWVGGIVAVGTAIYKVGEATIEVNGQSVKLFDILKTGWEEAKKGVGEYYDELANRQVATNKESLFGKAVSVLDYTINKPLGALVEGISPDAGKTSLQDTFDNLSKGWQKGFMEQARDSFSYGFEIWLGGAKKAIAETETAQKTAINQIEEERKKAAKATQDELDARARKLLFEGTEGMASEANQAMLSKNLELQTKISQSAITRIGNAVQLQLKTLDIEKTNLDKKFARAEIAIIDYYNQQIDLLEKKYEIERRGDEAKLQLLEQEELRRRTYEEQLLTINSQNAALQDQVTLLNSISSTKNIEYNKPLIYQFETADEQRRLEVEKSKEIEANRKAYREEQLAKEVEAYKKAHEGTLAGYKPSTDFLASVPLVTNTEAIKANTEKVEKLQQAVNEQNKKTIQTNLAIQERGQYTANVEQDITNLVTSALKPLSKGVDKWDSLIAEKAAKSNIPANFLKALVGAESSGNPRANSGEAQGLVQFTPDTGRRYGMQTLADRYDPNKNLEGSAAYVADIAKALGIDIWKATEFQLRQIVAAYNSGEGKANSKHRADLLAGRFYEESRKEGYDVINKMRKMGGIAPVAIPLSEVKGDAATNKAIAGQEIANNALVEQRVAMESKILSMELERKVLEDTRIAAYLDYVEQVQKSTLEFKKQEGTITDIERSNLIDLETVKQKRKLSIEEDKAKLVILDTTGRITAQEKEAARIALEAIPLAKQQLEIDKQRLLVKEKLDKQEDAVAAKREYEEARAQNLPMAQAASMGVSGAFVGAIVAEERAKSLSNTYQSELDFARQRMELETDPAKLDRLKARIEDVTARMRELDLAKNAVFNQALNDTMDSISNHFVAWANGAESVKDAFRGIAIDFAKMVQEIIMNELKMLAVKGIMSLITGGFSNVGSVGSLAGFGSTGATSAVGLFGFASGGQVSGKGTGTSDSIPAIVPIGSYVLNAKATSKAKRNRLINLSHGEVVFSPEQVAQLGLDNLDRMNKQNFASGGLVGGGTTTSTSSKAAKQNSNVYNINVAVPEGTSNAKQFGNEVGLEIMKAVAREEAKKQVNQYNKLKARG